MHEDVERCVRALRAKDARFDGWFFIAVITTRIYCRPSCPVAPAKPENMRFYPSAAAAQGAGFRACKRCRPDASPGSPLWNERADLVARTMRLIADGVVDRDGVTGLARRLGYSPRQIQRQVHAELGAGPLALARAQRAQTARVLIETTAVPMSDVAFAAGFASVRTFNDTVQEVFQLTPSQLRARAARGLPAAGAGTVELRLPFRAPLCPDNLVGHLAATAVPGIEEWRDGAYRRTLRLPHGHGVVALRPLPDYIACRLRLTDLRDLATAISRCRWLLDLDADPEAVDLQLRADPILAPEIAKNPGRRVLRTVDGAEFAVRAMLGGQGSEAVARRVTARLVTAHGEPVEDPDGGLTHLFPDTATLASLDPRQLAVPGNRRAGVTALIGALTTGSLDLGVGSDWHAARTALAEQPGVDPWIIETIAMRSLGDPDAFNLTDLDIKRAVAVLGLPSGRSLVEHARTWQPWRAYAVQYLWAAREQDINRLPA
ncbi:DNA-3-methyladenine glycosylase 2 family protein [Pseudonocardia spinosispora]|uniref:DNA-3-methyladenine glycosylase 2 family protein n=1 Tax=Pseudonocardia spinosispora TaxID=103441 RepID=UPI0003F5D7EA|nr:AlkA N-terminal domain-containing protein [Pseudonocardia spinosispora]